MIDPILTFLRIESPVLRKHIKQLVKFGMTGGIGSFIDLSALTLFVEYVGFPELLGGILSSLIAVTVVFTVNKFFTFRNHERTFAKQIAKFMLIYSMAFAMNIALYSLLLQFGLQYIIAKLSAILIIAVWNYYFSHSFIFKQK